MSSIPFPPLWILWAFLSLLFYFGIGELVVEITSQKSEVKVNRRRAWGLTLFSPIGVFVGIALCTIVIAIVVILILAAAALSLGVLIGMLALILAVIVGAAAIAIVAMVVFLIFNGLGVIWNILAGGVPCSKEDVQIKTEED